MTTSEMTPADIRACTGNDGNGMFGDNAWWIIVLLLFGWGRNGFGGGVGNGVPCATQADVRAAVDQQTLISKLDQQTYGLADSTYALNNAITTGFYGVQKSIDSCCCNTQRAIDGVNYGIATQTNALQNAMCNNTRDIIDNQNCNARAILDALTAQRIADKDERIAEQNQKIFSLELAASQAAQNSYLINQIKPCPVPAYITCNPYTSAYGFGLNAGCACAG
jgi:hypothetical protein